jgi:hypothetical protein
LGAAESVANRNECVFGRLDAPVDLTNSFKTAYFGLSIFPVTVVLIQPYLFRRKLVVYCSGAIFTAPVAVKAIGRLISIFEYMKLTKFTSRVYFRLEIGRERGVSCVMCN